MEILINLQITAAFIKFCRREKQQNMSLKSLVVEMNKQSLAKTCYPIFLLIYLDGLTYILQ